jgi:hypothetical protein
MRKGDIIMSSRRDLGITYAQLAKPKPKRDTGTERGTERSTNPPLDFVRHQSEIAEKKEKEANVQQSSSESRVTYAQVLMGMKPPESRSGKDSRFPTDESRISESPSYMQIFREFIQANNKLTIEEIIKLVPKDAYKYNIAPVKKSGDIGFKCKWHDYNNLKDDICDSRGRSIKYRHWEVYVRNPISGVNKDSNSKYWTLRVRVTEHYENGYEDFNMDSEGKFHIWWDSSAAADAPDPELVKKTHIPIQTPESYISPIDHPEHYRQ